MVWAIYCFFKYLDPMGRTTASAMQLQSEVLVTLARGSKDPNTEMKFPNTLLSMVSMALYHHVQVLRPSVLLLVQNRNDLQVGTLELGGRNAPPRRLLEAICSLWEWYGSSCDAPHSGPF